VGFIYENVQVIDETHGFWQALKSGKTPAGKLSV